MDDPAAAAVVAEVWERFWQLATFLRSEEALAMPFDELLATAESRYEALLALLRRGIAEQQARRAAGDAEVGEDGADGR